jgi:hypothetical protein
MASGGIAARQASIPTRMVSNRLLWTRRPNAPGSLRQPARIEHQPLGAGRIEMPPALFAAIAIGDLKARMVQAEDHPARRDRGFARPQQQPEQRRVRVRVGDRGAQFCDLVGMAAGGASEVAFEDVAGALLRSKENCPSVFIGPLSSASAR